jgi:hypothetical protein
MSPANNATRNILALVGVFTNKTIIYPRNVLAKNIHDSRNDNGRDVAEVIEID